MPAAPVETAFPFAITLLCYLATGLLFLIFLLLLIINSKLSNLSTKLTRNTRSTKVEDAAAPPTPVSVASGTHFEEFLNEDPERRKLAKKEQFNAYRKWRAERGLNWSK